MNLPSDQTSSLVSPPPPPPPPPPFLESDSEKGGGRRTLEEVSRTADAAGLRGSVGGVQLLHFSQDLHSEDIRIMELEKPVLSALRNGEK